VDQALRDLQSDTSGGAYRKIMSDRGMAAKIEKLIAAGILGVK
jgi:hypothetical protein